LILKELGERRRGEPRCSLRRSVKYTKKGLWAPRRATASTVLAAAPCKNTQESTSGRRGEHSEKRPKFFSLFALHFEHKNFANYFQ
jgi:hypothetical protein